RHTIARFTGTGATSTARFTVGGNGTWVLRYSYDCSAQPFGFGNFIVDEDAMNTDNPSAVAVNRLGRRGHGSWHVHGDAGRHYLAIHTKCSYAMSVVQKYGARPAGTRRGTAQMRPRSRPPRRPGPGGRPPRTAIEPGRHFGHLVVTSVVVTGSSRLSWVSCSPAAGSVSGWRAAPGTGGRPPCR